MSAFDGYREDMQGLGRLVAGGTMTDPHNRRMARHGIGATALLAAVGVALAGAILGTLFFW